MFGTAGIFRILCAVTLLSGCAEPGYVMLQPDGGSDLRLPPSVCVLWEIVAVDAEAFSGWVLENPLDPGNATPLRRQAQAWIREGDGRIVETSVVQVRSGQRAKVASVREVFAPTEYRYPVRLSVTTSTSGGGSNTVRTTDEEPLLMVAPTGHGFVAHPVGTTFEVQAEIEEGAIRLALSGDRIHSMEALSWTAKASGGDAESFDAPVFDKNGITSEIILQDGIYGLMGSGTMPNHSADHSRPESQLLFFIRADSNQISQKP